MKKYAYALILLTVADSSCMLQIAKKSQSEMLLLRKQKQKRLRLLKKVDKRNFSRIQKRHFMNSLKFFVIVRQQESGIIERFGKFDRLLNSGIHFKTPIIENLREISWSKNDRVDLRERVHDLPAQWVITEDNVQMAIGGIIYYKIDDPKRAVYEVVGLPSAIEKLAQTTLRNIVGSMNFDKTLTSRDQINSTLCSTLDGATDKWGVTVTRVELQEITPPQNILKAMERQMTAERERRAIVTEAEGNREALIKKAEGEKSAAIKKAEAQKAVVILQAEGDAESRTKNALAEATAIKLLAESEAEARVKKAEAEARAVEIISAASGENATDYIKTLEYIKALPQMTHGNNKMVIVPTELSSLTSLLSVGKEIIKDKE